MSDGEDVTNILLHSTTGDYLHVHILGTRHKWHTQEVRSLRVYISNDLRGESAGGCAAMLIAAGFHQSVWMIIDAAVLAYFVKNSYYYLAGWLLCVVVSYFFGETIQVSIAGLCIFVASTVFWLPDGLQL